MGSKVLYIYLCKENKKLDSQPMLNDIMGKEDYCVVLPFEDKDRTELYYQLKPEINKFVNDVNNFDYVCLISEGSTINPNIGKIFREYQEGKENQTKVTYFPMSIYNFSIKEEKKTLVMNKHVWNSMIASEAGVLDFELAKRQIDSTIFGSFIPIPLFFNEDYYDKEVKYYQQYHLLTNLADGENTVIGIPKLALTDLKWDFVLENLSQEEKAVEFKKAGKKWEKEKK